MNFESKFNQGDTVYVIDYRDSYKRTHANCNACNSSGEITINSEVFKCPKCYGHYYSELIGIEWYICEKYGKIGKITIENYLKETKYHKSKITYMLGSTGIGSGSFYNEKDLFINIEDAKKECEIRNQNQTICCQ